MTSKQEQYEKLHKALHACTEEGTERLAVVVLIDNHADTVKVYGLNVEPEDVPQLLVDTAQELYERAAATHIASRMLN